MARGTRFSNAYTNCPICVPARACFATGQHVHKIRYWDNAIAYDGLVPSWGHRLMAQGRRVTAIGKLYYFASDPARNGFDEEILPLHIVNGVGGLPGLIRDEPPRRPTEQMLKNSLTPTRLSLRGDAADDAPRKVTREDMRQLVSVR